MTKALVVITSKTTINHHSFSHDFPFTHEDEKDFIDRINSGIMREPGARVVSYTGDQYSGFKVVVEIDA